MAEYEVIVRVLAVRTFASRKEAKQAAEGWMASEPRHVGYEIRRKEMATSWKTPSRLS